jgi:putative transposase
MSRTSAECGSRRRHHAEAFAHLLSDLGITKSHSGSHVWSDNPSSEAHFKTLKYRPNFPKRFGALEDARVHLTDFFAWYNTNHWHGSLGLHTSHDVHHGLADARNAAPFLRKHPELGRPSPQC